MPKTTEQQTRQQSRREALLNRLPYFIGAILAHLIVFLMLATFVMFKAPVTHDEAAFQQVKIATVPPPPPAPPAASGGEAQSALEPEQAVTPPPTPMSAIATSTASAFSMKSVQVAMPTLSSLPAKGSGLSSAGASGSGIGAGSVFGSGTGGGNGLTGYFYDLKQTPDHKATGMNAEKEQALLRHFFETGWNEDDWATKFLKSPKPLVANELMVPLRLSKEGPKAYGMEDVCQPGYWCAIYHLKFTAPRSGNYRLAGYGDDFLVARVDGQLVLDSGWFPPVTQFKRDKAFAAKWLKHKSVAQSTYGQTVVGSPFRMNMGETMSIDVLLGDADDAHGQGLCGYFLFLLQDGKEYDMDAAGNPLLPVLQVQPNPELSRPGDRPPFTAKPEDALLGL